jgi:hypothetical protein
MAAEVIELDDHRECWVGGTVRALAAAKRLRDVAGMRAGDAYTPLDADTRETVARDGRRACDAWRSLRLPSAPESAGRTGAEAAKVENSMADTALCGLAEACERVGGIAVNPREDLAGWRWFEVGVAPTASEDAAWRRRITDYATAFEDRAEQLGRVLGLPVAERWREAQWDASGRDIAR